MLAVVLVVDAPPRPRASRRSKSRRSAPPSAPRAIGIAAPGEIGLGEIALAPPSRARRSAPAAPRHRRPGLRAEDAVAARGARRLSARCRGLERARDRLSTRAASGLTLGRLVERRDRARGAVDEIDQIGKGVAEEAGDAERHVDPRPVEDARAAGSRSRSTRPVPGSQRGRTPMSASACAISSPPVRMLAVPQAESARRARIVAMLLAWRSISSSADFQPSCQAAGRRHGAAVERVEIAPGRQHLGPPARRRARRSGRDEAAVRALRALPRSRPPRMPRVPAGRAPRSSRAPRACRSSSRSGAALAGDERLREELEPLDRVALRCATTQHRQGPVAARRSSSRRARNRAGRSRARCRDRPPARAGARRPRLRLFRAAAAPGRRGDP